MLSDEDKEQAELRRKGNRAAWDRWHSAKEKLKRMRATLERIQKTQRRKPDDPQLDSLIKLTEACIKNYEKQAAKEKA
jgi:hypothetical protein